MKIAPLIREIEAHNRENSLAIEHVLVHTGQHYDDKMNRAFFDALDIPEADINLGVGSGTHAEQVGQTMMAFEKVLRVKKPDWVLLVGDVNATLACSVTAKKEWVRCCHIEAGLRSGDMTMPEEINRLVTDRLSDLLLTPDELSSENLRKEGVSEERIRCVGNIMIDTLETQRHKAEKLSIEQIIQDNNFNENLHPFTSSSFAVMTLHRASNVDNPVILGALLDFLCDEVCEEMPLVWPVHPRTENNLKTFGLWNSVMDSPNMILLYPIGYHEMLRLNMDARIMLTDSGGLQEECCVLGTPCLTLRWNTERPITLQKYGGASMLVGSNVEDVREGYRKALKQYRKPSRPKFWDGKSASRCLRALLEFKI
jgi:UDP-N-acetylglucosamine 2-epimerase (non-hydrolysing)